MENKYYTPTLEEFHRGFEYEEETIIYTDKGWFTHKGLGWEKKVFNPNDYSETYYLAERVRRGLVGKMNPTIRCKYLDNDDFESIGITYAKQLDESTHISQFGYGSYTFEYDFDYKYLHIYKVYDGFDVDTKFAGNVNNKSELKILLKWLDITPQN